MKITNASRELTNAEKYFLTKAADIKGLKDAAGSTLDVDVWCEYTDTVKDGDTEKEMNFLSIRTPEGETYVTNSKTAIDNFHDIAEIFNPEEIKKLKIEQGTSKVGRHFIMVSYAE